MYMVTTMEDARVFAGVGKIQGWGATSPTANANAEERNKRAAALGIATRYKVAEYVAVAE